MHPGFRLQIPKYLDEWIHSSPPCDSLPLLLQSLGNHLDSIMTPTQIDTNRTVSAGEVNAGTLLYIFKDFTPAH